MNAPHAPRTGWRTYLFYALAACLLGQSSFAKEADTPVDAANPTEMKLPGELQRIEVFPQQFQLKSSRQTLRPIVTGHLQDGTVVDVTPFTEFVSGSPDLLAVENSTLRPLGNGQVEVTARVAGREDQISLNVSGQDQAERVSFQYETLVALSKQGCNSGACHGSPSGKGGFRLSLRAYDPELDKETLIREEFNRRVNLHEPEKSLLLRKPLTLVSHGGGRQLREADPAYELLRNWIAEGCQLDPPDMPQCLRIEVYPSRRVLQLPARQRLLVLAHFSDGTSRDITPLAVYSSSDEGVATVTSEGHVQGAQKGETAILVRYLEHMATSRLTLLEETEGFEWPHPPAHNYVDELVFAKLRQLQIPPSVLCRDDEFLRRIYLDVLGVLPTAEEARQFLADEDSDKRNRVIDRVLERPEYASLWAMRWGDLLRLNEKEMGPRGVPKFHRWLEAAFRDNMPYDEFAGTLLVSEGDVSQNPSANYYRALSDANECAETTAQVFLGIRIQCAKCHNHPFERWTQDNYYGIGAFFNRVRRKTAKANNEFVVWVARSGEVTQPRTGQTMAPWLPLAGEAEIGPEGDRRDALIEWLGQPDNPFFAKAEVNRMWGYLFGRGLVDPVDDFRDSNPPAHEELLEALAREFVASGFDRKHILRTILRSRTYQLSYETNSLNASDEKYFSHARPRLLGAEPLLDAVCQVTGVGESYGLLPEGTRATELPAPHGEHEFLKVFGQPARETACQCERSSESNLSQALQMINGPVVHRKLIHENNRIRGLMKSASSDERILEELFLTAFARQPTPAETKIALAHLHEAENRETAWEDICWGILNTKEFLFQH